MWPIVEPRVTAQFSGKDDQGQEERMTPWGNRRGSQSSIQTAEQVEADDDCFNQVPYTIKSQDKGAVQ